MPPVAVTLIAVVVQFNVVVPVLFVIPTVGAVVFCVTVIDDCDEHPFAAVAVTVYVPGLVMVAVDELPKPPVHT